LQKLPLSKLMAPAGRGGAGGGGSAGPVVDGRSLLQQTWDPVAPEVSAGIPMIVGNCKDEATLFSADQTLFSLDDAGLRDRVTRAGIPESDVDHLLALYRRDHPSETPSDLYFRLASDRGARRNAVTQAERRLAQGKANSYVYHFEWNTPMLDGKLRAFHTAELPLAMRLVAYLDAETVSRQVSGAWASFARNGDPNHSGMPKWLAYSANERSTILFNRNTEVLNDPDKDERLALLKYPVGGLL
jgi:para-nitrobenzyl esterase